MARIDNNESGLPVITQVGMIVGSTNAEVLQKGMVLCGDGK